MHLFFHSEKRHPACTFGKMFSQLPPCHCMYLFIQRQTHSVIQRQTHSAKTNFKDKDTWGTLYALLSIHRHIKSSRTPAYVGANAVLIHCAIFTNELAPRTCISALAANLPYPYVRPSPPQNCIWLLPY